MKYTVPDYYRQFRCIASECPATCCAGWQIVIDDKSLKKYQGCRTAFGNRLANSIDWKEKTFLQYEGRCAFLDENNLCDIYSEAGADMLCRTCRRYPRHVEEFENEREISLSISCPVVAKMLLNREERVTFLEAEKAGEEEEDESFDFFLYSALQDCRSVMFDILQDRENTIGFRMAKVLALAHDVQNRIDARRLFEVEALLERYQRPGADAKLKQKFLVYSGVEGQRQRMNALLELLGQLEVLDESWPAQIAEYGYIRNRMSEKESTAGEADAPENHASVIAREKQGENGSAGAGRKEEIQAEQLMVYFLFTYLCGAVYDGDAFAKVKMAVVSTLLLLDLMKADRENQEQTVWRFSRELEHSDQNLNRMEELMKESEAAEFEELLKCVLA